MSKVTRELNAIIKLAEATQQLGLHQLLVEWRNKYIHQATSTYCVSAFAGDNIDIQKFVDRQLRYSLADVLPLTVSKALGPYETIYTANLTILKEIEND